MAIDAQAATREPYSHERTLEHISSRAAPYIYTDPASGMQRRHDPANYAHLRREVGLRPTPDPATAGSVGSLRSLAFNALAETPPQLQLPDSLEDELSIRRNMMTQRQLAMSHARHGRIEEAAVHTRNALAYEKQLVKKGVE
jgi:hypothetical protein